MLYLKLSIYAYIGVCCQFYQYNYIVGKERRNQEGWIVLNILLWEFYFYGVFFFRKIKVEMIETPVMGAEFLQ